MPDDFSLKRSARLNAAYADYRAALDGSGVAKRFMPYRWWTLPNPISGLWLVYSSMLEDYATDLANVINDLKLRASLTSPQITQGSVEGRIVHALFPDILMRSAA